MSNFKNKTCGKRSKKCFSGNNGLLIVAKNGGKKIYETTAFKKKYVKKRLSKGWPTGE